MYEFKGPGRFLKCLLHALTLIEMLVILNESLKKPWPHYILANVMGKGHLIIACFRKEKKIKIKLILMSV